MDLRQLKIIYEDNHLIAVNKPVGWLVQGDQTGDTPLLDYVKQYIKVKYKKEGDVFLGLVHRIDRPVSGVVVFARTSKALTRMTKMFKERSVKKLYWAVTLDRPNELEGKLVHWLTKNFEKNVARAYPNERTAPNSAKKSELSYELLATFSSNCLLEVKPTTGRPHQIRVQLAKMGSPIRGDRKYGYKGKPHPDNAIYLHARALSFIHPVKKEPIKIWAKVPKDQIWNEFKDIHSYF